MKPRPGEGWEKNGIYRIAHNMALDGDYRKCVTMKDENEAYEKFFRKALNSVISRQGKYESIKARNRETRRLLKDKREAEKADKQKEVAARAKKLDDEIRLEFQKLQRDQAIEKKIKEGLQEKKKRSFKHEDLKQHLIEDPAPDVRVNEIEDFLSKQIEDPFKEEGNEENDENFLDSESAWDMSSDIIFEGMTYAKEMNE